VSKDLTLPLQSHLSEPWIADPITPAEIACAERLTIALWVLLTAIAVALVTL